MVYDHIVKFGGKFYAAGDNVPDDTKTPINENTTQEVAAEMPSLNDEAPQYTKSQISTMSTAGLQKLADSVGIANAFETSGRGLKKILIEHFGL